jgi:hypothetical protein
MTAQLMRPNGVAVRMPAKPKQPPGVGLVFTRVESDKRFVTAIPRGDVVEIFHGTAKGDVVGYSVSSHTAFSLGMWLVFRWWVVATLCGIRLRWWLWRLKNRK